MLYTLAGCPDLRSSKYLEHDCDGKTLKILTTDDIENYDQNEVDNDLASLNLRFKCADGNTCDLVSFLKFNFMF